MAKRPVKLTPARRRSYCEALRSGLTHKSAAAKIGMHPDAVSKHYRPGGEFYDPEFEAEVRIAEGESLAEIEMSLVEIGIKGAQRTILDKRGELKTVTDAPDVRALQIMAQARNRHLYGNKVQLSGGLTVERVETISGELEKMPDELFKRLEEMIDRERQRRFPGQQHRPAIFGDMTDAEVMEHARKLRDRFARADGWTPPPPRLPDDVADAEYIAANPETDPDA